MFNGIFITKIILGTDKMVKYSTSPIPLNYPRSTSPLPAPANYQQSTPSAAAKRYIYLRRLFKFNQMDFDFAAWQMVYLFVSPQKVFRNSNYRKRKDNFNTFNSYSVVYVLVN